MYLYAKKIQRYYFLISNLDCFHVPKVAVRTSLPIAGCSGSQYSKGCAPTDAGEVDQDKTGLLLPPYRGTGQG